jgi:hypothetical protein
MKRIPRGTPMIRVQIDRILESAVVLSWKDLVHASQGGPIDIEYAPATHRPYLKIWQMSRRGAWTLVCEYWMARGPTAASVGTLTFSNGYHSAGLAEMLEVIMQHHDNFAPGLNFGAGVVQVIPPTEQENSAAEEYMRHVYESFGLTFAHIPAAALA